MHFEGYYKFIGWICTMKKLLGLLETRRQQQVNTDEKLKTLSADVCFAFSWVGLLVYRARRRQLLSCIHTLMHFWFTYQHLARRNSKNNILGISVLTAAPSLLRSKLKNSTKDLLNRALQNRTTAATLCLGLWWYNGHTLGVDTVYFGVLLNVCFWFFNFWFLLNILQWMREVSILQFKNTHVNWQDTRTLNINIFINLTRHLLQIGTTQTNKWAHCTLTQMATYGDSSSSIKML